MIAPPPPTFYVAVTGHPKAIPGGYWTASPVQRMDISRPGVHLLRSYLDGVLYRRREKARVIVLVRGGSAGVDHAVRAYTEARGCGYLVVDENRETWGAQARFRRDMELIMRAHALVWFGPREEREDGPDPVTLAALLGIPFRVCEISATADVPRRT